ncbi:hypothetical protein QOZ88_05945 [Blastococcus sp. BMG 814]|uniref:Uncharacterized protein n=1 Tax=Blastococcus carthaginiensis TaxID=3050034 RepID=A0ABT9IAA7_9ACTN|nr:hypothetical protein [Blastococcus carthaginiensis]MDP5182172.1 hypothetical protein [Blastococcus carthaginiensis]
MPASTDSSPLTAAAHDLAAAFLKARHAKHLDFRMEGGAEGAPAGGPAGEPDPQGGEPGGTDTEPTDLTAQVEKWKALARKHENAWKSTADKARQFDELTEAQKTELQKATDRAAAAEAKAAEIEARAMRAEVAAAKGIPANLLSGSTQEELEASADALLAFRGPATRSATPEEAAAGKQGEDISAPKQLTREDLKSMSASQIMAAQKAGQLKTLLQGA